MSGEVNDLLVEEKRSDFDPTNSRNKRTRVSSESFPAHEGNNTNYFTTLCLGVIHLFSPVLFLVQSGFVS